jgi:hypothetical protein
MKTLASKYRGYWNYYGVGGNSKSLEQFFQQTRRILLKWLNRRSQKKSYTARGFERLLRRFQIPHPWIVEKDPVPIRRRAVAADVDAALKRCFGATTISCQVRKRDVMKSPGRENRTPGSVRRTPGNGRPYLDLRRLPAHGRLRSAFSRRRGLGGAVRSRQCARAGDATSDARWRPSCAAPGDSSLPSAQARSSKSARVLRNRIAGLRGAISGCGSRSQARHGSVWCSWTIRPLAS